MQIPYKLGTPPGASLPQKISGLKLTASRRALLAADLETGKVSLPRLPRSLAAPA